MMTYLAILSSGAMVGGAFAAFYGALGVFSKVFYISGLVKGYRILAFSLSLGIVFGSVVTLYDISINQIWLSNAFMFFGGAFIGIYIALLAEVLKIIPVLSDFGFVKSFIFVAVLAVALGKFAGSLVYFIIPYFR